MNHHDPLCMSRVLPDAHPDLVCTCEYVEKVRADERRIMALTP